MQCLYAVCVEMHINQLTHCYQSARVNRLDTSSTCKSICAVTPAFTPSRRESGMRSVHFNLVAM